MTKLPLAAALLFFMATAAEAHPFHVSIAEAEYKADRGTLEVALRVHPSDLEEALRRQSGRRIVLENDAAADPQIVAWLQQSFVVKTADGKTPAIRYVGKEVSVKHAWLYFEVSLPGGLEDVEFTNRIFFELLSDQVNTVNLRDGERKTTLHFLRSKPRQRVVFE